jgi:hypothetical protein
MNQTVLILLVVVLLGVAALVLSRSKEGFWMTPSRTWKVDKEFKNQGSSDFFSTPNFQAILSPRFSNVDYGANLRTQFPSYSKMGVPADPLSEDPLNIAAARENTPYSDTIEPYTSSSGIPLDPHNPYSSSYTNGNYDAVLDKVVTAGASGWPTSTIEQGETATFMTPDGDLKQPIVYDIYANRNSRLRGQGDPIRGDLPIVPISGSWFIPSGAFEGPNVVLQQGAMNVMGGVNNETNNQLANLIYNSSGGAETTIGGVDMKNINMSRQVYGSTTAARGDISMTAFP